MITFKETYEIVMNSAVFKKFKQEHSNAELVAGFFIIDFLSNDNKESVDYKLPETESDKIYTFELDKNKEVVMKQDRLVNPDMPTQQKLTKINSEVKIDLDIISNIAKEKARENKITAEFSKIIAVLQNHENQLIWNLTCMLDQLIILHVLINSETGEVLKFERKSMMDFIKKH
ncbi:MAG: hypothetical protein WCX73_01290 [Candidatus Pacearchaeota archaeon]